MSGFAHAVIVNPLRYHCELAERFPLPDFHRTLLVSRRVNLLFAITTLEDNVWRSQKFE